MLLVHDDLQSNTKSYQTTLELFNSNINGRPSPLNRMQNESNISSVRSNRDRRNVTPAKSSFKSDDRRNILEDRSYLQSSVRSRTSEVLNNRKRPISPEQVSFTYEYVVTPNKIACLQNA